MITEALLTVLFGIVSMILSLFSFLPDMPATLTAIWDTIVEYLGSALELVFFFFDHSLLAAGLTLLLTLFIGEKVVDVVLWVWKLVHGNVGE